MDYVWMQPIFWTNEALHLLKESEMQEVVVRDCHTTDLILTPKCFVSLNLGKESTLVEVKDMYFFKG